MGWRRLSSETRVAGPVYAMVLELMHIVRTLPFWSPLGLVLACTTTSSPTKYLGALQEYL